MSIKKVGSNKWVVKVSVWDKWKGYPVVKQKTVIGTISTANCVESDLRNQLRTRSLKTCQISFFGEAVDMYVARLRNVNTLCFRHEAKMLQLRQELGHIKLEEFADRFDLYLKNFLASTTRRGAAPSRGTINSYIASVRAIFNHLVKLEMLDKNPITIFRFPIVSVKPRDRYLEPEERETLFAAIEKYHPFLLPFVRYMMLVPCRVSELTTAKREQYNPFTNTVYIPDSKAGIPIYKPVPEEMRNYFLTIPESCAWLFYKRSGLEYKRFSPAVLFPAWNFCRRKSGLLDVTLHDLRHVAATDLYEAGNSERVIMDIAGWKTNMLSTYRHKNSLRSAQGTVFKAVARPVKEEILPVIKSL